MLRTRCLARTALGGMQWPTSRTQWGPRNSANFNTLDDISKPNSGKRSDDYNSHGFRILSRPQRQHRKHGIASEKSHQQSQDTASYVHPAVFLARFQATLVALADDSRMAEKIISWGVCGAALREAAATIDGPESRTKTDRNAITKLLQYWARMLVSSLPSVTVGRKGEQVNGDMDWNRLEESELSISVDLEQVRNAYLAEGESSLKREQIHLFLRWLISRVRALDTTEMQSALLAHLDLLLRTSDMRMPAMGYSAARSMKRSIHLHVGPTNSGKTHGALVALCKARTGMYAGPLRLLAHEVWDRINAGTVSPCVAPRSCNLVTGEEVRTTDEFAGILACTVEMANLERPVDVAVIDEIQMIGDPQRGSAWTNAVLGIPARELHLCGESSVVPLLRKMADACGDDIEVHEYERLTPLNLGEDLKGGLENIRRGDCVVAFSRTLLFSLKRDIEQRTGLRCAIAYGALPPETKSEQAKIFNDPNSDVDVMVASDAVGMGLNLKIKRVVFSSVTKWNGKETVPISTSQLKQIAGRAGRYGTSNDDRGGLATTLWPRDLEVLRKALDAPLLPITRAAIQPSSEALASFSTLLPRLSGGHRPRPLSMLLEDMSTLTRIDSQSYFLANLEQQLIIAPIVERALPASAKLCITERERFSVAPANIRDERLMILLSHMVTAYASGSLINFQAVENGLGMLDVLRRIQDPRSNQRGDVNSLMILESLHRGMTLYLWLSFRFPLSFCARWEVERLKVETENAIDDCLEAIRASRKVRLARRAALLEDRVPDEEEQRRGSPE